MGWDQAILTDSGGFQAFALSQFAKVQEEGIEFRSHRDGSRHLFTPERVVSMQEKLGVDMATCLDVCTGFPASEAEVHAAVMQTNRWAERSVAAWTDQSIHLYGMVQGSIYEQERRHSAEFLRELPFAGFAIGGNMYTFGAPLAELEAEKPRMWEIVALTSSLLPGGKPRHLLGVGEPADLIRGVQAGVDTFDCVMASRIARHGAAWIRTGPESWEYERLNVRAARWAASGAPVDEYCQCPVCSTGLSRSYLNHLFKIGDAVAGTYLTVHNVSFLRDLSRELRAAILEGSLAEKFRYTT